MSIELRKGQTRHQQTISGAEGCAMVPHGYGVGVFSESIRRTYDC